jgi:anti-sigma B factor antagonist
MFEVAESLRGDELEVRPIGELDALTGPRLREYVRHRVPTFPRVVAVDLSEVTLLDSSGVRALLEVQQMVAPTSSTLVVRRPQEPVARVLRVMGVDRILTVEGMPPER